MEKLCKIAGISLCLSLVAACGGGGSGAPVAAQANKAVVFGAADSFGNLTGASNGIKGIQVTATLPAGVFPNISSGRFLRIGETGLKSLKGNAFIPFGRYSATTNQVVFALVANPIDSSIGTGDFARLAYNGGGETLGASGFEPTVYKVAGPGGTDISARVTKTIRLTTF